MVYFADAAVVPAQLYWRSSFAFCRTDDFVSLLPSANGTGLMISLFFVMVLMSCCRRAISSGLYLCKHQVILYELFQLVKGETASHSDGCCRDLRI